MQGESRRRLPACARMPVLVEGMVAEVMVAEVMVAEVLAPGCCTKFRSVSLLDQGV